MSSNSSYVSYDTVDRDIDFSHVPSPCPSSEFGWNYQGKTYQKSKLCSVSKKAKRA